MKVLGIFSGIGGFEFGLQRDGIAHVTTATWCRKNPPTITVGIGTLKEASND